jgi:hypothetical protein
MAEIQSTDLVWKIDLIFSSNVGNKRVWRKSMEKCKVVDPPVLWEDVIDLGLQHWCKKTLFASVSRLVFGASLYHLWRTRNEIRHGGILWSERKRKRSVLGKDHEEEFQ